MKKDVKKKVDLALAVETWPDGVLDEVIHGYFSSHASQLNNQGVWAQVVYLRKQGCTDEEILGFAKR